MADSFQCMTKFTKKKKKKQTGSCENKDLTRKMESNEMEQNLKAISRPQLLTSFIFSKRSHL